MSQWIHFYEFKVFAAGNQRELLVFHWDKCSGLTRWRDRPFQRKSHKDQACGVTGFVEESDAAIFQDGEAGIHGECGIEEFSWAPGFAVVIARADGHGDALVGIVGV